MRAGENERWREGWRRDFAVLAACERDKIVAKSEARRRSRAHAEARERLELSWVLASGGEGSGRSAGDELSGGQMLDDAQAAAAARTSPTGLNGVFVRERDPARRVDASDQPAAQRQ